MKHQQVSVDYWAMLKSMMTYGVLTVLGWLMFRLFNAVFTLPRRLRTQQQNIKDTIQEFQNQQENENNCAENEFSVFYTILISLGWMMMIPMFDSLWSRWSPTQHHEKDGFLKDLQRRYPDLNITEDDLKEAEKEFEQWSKEIDQKIADGKKETVQEATPDTGKPEAVPAVETKKSI